MVNVLRHTAHWLRLAHTGSMEDIKKTEDSYNRGEKLYDMWACVEDENQHVEVLIALSIHLHTMKTLNL